MNFTDMMEGLREAAAKRTKYVGINLTMAEADPILAEYDELCAEIKRLQQRMKEIIDNSTRAIEDDVFLQAKLRAKIEDCYRVAIGQDNYGPHSRSAREANARLAEIAEMCRALEGK